MLVSLVLFFSLWSLGLVLVLPVGLRIFGFVCVGFGCPLGPENIWFFWFWFWVYHTIGKMQTLTVVLNKNATRPPQKQKTPQHYHNKTQQHHHKNTAISLQNLHRITTQTQKHSKNTKAQPKHKDPTTLPLTCAQIPIGTAMTVHSTIELRTSHQLENALCRISYRHSDNCSTAQVQYTKELRRSNQLWKCFVSRFHRHSDECSTAQVQSTDSFRHTQQ